MPYHAVAEHCCCWPLRETHSIALLCHIIAAKVAALLLPNQHYYFIFAPQPLNFQPNPSIQAHPILLCCCPVGSHVLGSLCKLAALNYLFMLG
ncbi:hypothetical protein VNO77_33070 [Canavalia gladiata]|uniref:Uncharacterized protein n=1 Tax=Canavalia gladiata TaxID=3824 RepID=A0AAN9KEX3_CANGL